MRKPKPIDLGKSGARLNSLLSERIIGQPDALEAIIPFVQMYQCGLAPGGRPIGVFLLLGPTGVGKSQTVEALAEVIHGSPRNVIRIDCGEYQLDHEVARLVGAPPGYLGHRETVPRLTQSKLNQVMSDRANLAIILFDEIEKAAPALVRLLLGVLDKGILNLGDNTTVCFDRAIIFMTSNLGAREMANAITPGFGFESVTAERKPDISQADQSRLKEIAVAAVKRKFSPEFVNRIDAMLTYKPLSLESTDKILDILLEDIGDHVRRRLGDRMFYIELPKRARRFLLEKGVSKEYGARELKRTLHRYLMQPLAALLTDGAIPPGAIVRVEPHSSGSRLEFTPKLEAAGEKG